MRLGARRPSGAWRALKSGLFGVAPGRTPPAGPSGLVLLGTVGRLSRLARFRSQDRHHHTVRRCMDPARPVEAVWLVAEARLEWFCLEDDDCRPQLPDAQGVLHSGVFPGPRLPVSPPLAGDTANPGRRPKQASRWPLTGCPPLRPPLRTGREPPRSLPGDSP